MLKRLLVAALVFVVSLGAFNLPTLITIYRGISEERATGFALVAGSVGENIFRIGGLIVSAALAWWLSGKLVRY